MSDKAYEPFWVEFNSAVYVGEFGYVNKIFLHKDAVTGRANEAFATTYTQEKGMFIFTMPGRTYISVPLSNIRYVYGNVQAFAEIPKEEIAPEPAKRGRPAKAKE